MNRIKSFIKIVRNNPKKSALAAAIVGYGLNFVEQKIRINKIIKVYCEEASKYSELPLSPFKHPRHVTVILNPVAKGRKSKNDYDKYISPILNCSGIKVSLIVTESEGQARELMEIMENTDAVLIAGGSGTIHEAVTGMLRRADGKVIPLGIVPTGKLNSSAFNVHDYTLDKLRWSKDGSYVGLVRAIAESTIAVVRETMTNINVLDIESKSRNKHVYALNGVNFGSIRDTLSTADKYWYFGNSMKPYLAMIRKSLFRDLKTLCTPYDVTMKYTESCDGCSKCAFKYASKIVLEEKEIETKEKRWWSSFVPKNPKKVNQETSAGEPEKDYSLIVNEKCGIWKDLDTTANLINMIVSNSADKNGVRVMIHSRPNESDGTQTTVKGSIITDAGRIFQGQLPQYSNDTLISDSQIRFNNNDQTRKGMDRKISIDGEEYELDDLDITLLPRKLPVYTSPHVPANNVR